LSLDKNLRAVADKMGWAVLSIADGLGVFG